jgi:signal transduction histidine kinase
VLNARSFQREQRATAYKQQLIGTMAHELKNPLAAVSGYAAILEDLLDDELAGRAVPGIEKSLRGIGRAATRLGDIVADLLAMARVEDEVDRSRLVPVDLRRVVHDAAELLSVQAAARDVTLTCDLPAEPVMVLGESGDLERLVANLLSNAVKYSHDGGAVELGLHPVPGSRLLLEVTDHGIGISPEDQEHLYDEFFRSADPAAASQGGTGLGLAIAKRVVDRHGGSLAVRSGLGQGSTFSVVLPRLAP